MVKKRVKRAYILPPGGAHSLPPSLHGLPAAAFKLTDDLWQKMWYMVSADHSWITTKCATRVKHRCFKHLFVNCIGKWYEKLKNGWPIKYMLRRVKIYLSNSSLLASADKNWMIRVWLTKYFCINMYSFVFMNPPPPPPPPNITWSFWANFRQHVVTYVCMWSYIKQIFTTVRMCKINYAKFCTHPHNNGMGCPWIRL